MHLLFRCLISHQKKKKKERKKERKETAHAFNARARKISTYLLRRLPVEFLEYLKAFAVLIELGL